MSVPATSQGVIVSLAKIEPDRLVRRCRADGLARLAQAVGVARTGAKPVVAARIVARAQLLERALTLGDDPARLARVFKAESLRLLVEGLGGFTGVPKYGLAAQVIGRRDAILRSIGADLADGS